MALPACASFSANRVAHRDDDKYWQSNTKEKDEWIGVQFEKAVDVMQVKMKAFSLTYQDRCITLMDLNRYTTSGVLHHLS